MWLLTLANIRWLEKWEMFIYNSGLYATSRIFNLSFLWDFRCNKITVHPGKAHGELYLSTSKEQTRGSPDMLYHNIQHTHTGCSSCITHHCRDLLQTLDTNKTGDLTGGGARLDLVKAGVWRWTGCEGVLQITAVNYLPKTRVENLQRIPHKKCGLSPFLSFWPWKGCF